MTDAPPPPRTYEVHARTSPVFGRVLCSARHHHFVVDGPVQNGCPGEALTPPEVFLSAVAACGAERIEVIAREDGVPLTSVAVTIRGTVDRSAQPREDVTVFTEVHVAVRLAGPEEAQGTALVRGFQRRCPLYGTVAVSGARMVVDVAVEGAG